MLAKRWDRLVRQRADSVRGQITSLRSDTLRRQADRTGNRGLSMEADTIDTVQRYREEANAIRSRLVKPDTTQEERDDLLTQLRDIPNQLRLSVGDITRSKSTTDDIVRSATASNLEVGTFSGAAFNATAKAKSEEAGLLKDVSDKLQKLIDLQLKQMERDANTVPLGSIFGDD